MKNLNLVMLIGTILDEPLKDTAPGNVPCLDILLAVNDYDGPPDPTRAPLRLTVEAYGKLAEGNPWIRAGAVVLVSGRLRRACWTNKRGDYREKLVIIANHIEPIRGQEGQREEIQGELMDSVAISETALAWPFGETFQGILTAAAKAKG